MSEKLRARYNHLCNLQGRCDLLSPKDSIELTKLIKTGQCVEIAIHLMELLVKANTPKHETVLEWEERTGEGYPDDGPVWVRAWKCNERKPVYCLPVWKLWKHKESKIDPNNIVFVATHHGKPEDK